MTKQSKHKVLETGVAYLDELMGGGLTECSISVIGGSPGSGKTILAQQIGFYHASKGGKVLFIQTLSEPTIKTLYYLQQFNYFNASALQKSVHFIDLGIILKTEGLEPAATMIMDHIRREKPSLVVIDSFRVFDDIANNRDDLRRFSYELAVNMTAWECTTVLLGEFGPKDFETNPLFSVIDALIMATQEEVSGEQQRFLQIIKMRGANHDRTKHSFKISEAGIELFVPRLMVHVDEAAARQAASRPRLKTGIALLDDLLIEGIPWGSTNLISGLSGTGKTVLLLEVIYRGAKRGEKGLYVSFEQSPVQLLEMARGLGWDLQTEIDKGLVEILYIAPPAILMEANLEAIHERLQRNAFALVALDSLSRFLHRVKDSQVAREKIFHLVTMVQNTGAIALFSTDIPSGSERYGVFGLEETMVDGLILLTLEKQGRRRQRYLEVYKFRNTAHQLGQHPMAIGRGGILAAAETDS